LAAQIALQTTGLVPDGACWFAGQGPLAALYAAQTIRSGRQIAGILDMSSPSSRCQAMRHLPGAIAEMRRGIGWLLNICRAGVPVVRGGEPHAEGDGELRRISFRVNAVQRSEPADLLLLHAGIVPSIQLTRAMCCAHVWDGQQHCWRPGTDAWDETTVPGVTVAGDHAGVGRAAVAILFPARSRRLAARMRWVLWARQPAVVRRPSCARASRQGAGIVIVH
jgi:hypothetical protein